MRPKGSNSMISRTRIVHFLLLFVVVWFMTALAAFLSGKIGLHISPGIFRLYRQTESSIGKWIFAMGIFVDDMGWVIASLVGGSIMGACIRKDGKKWGFAVGVLLNSVHLGIILNLKFFKKVAFPLFLPDVFSYFAVFSLSYILGCAIGGLGGYCGEKVALALSSRRQASHS